LYEPPLQLFLGQSGGLPYLWWFGTGDLLEESTDLGAWSPAPGGISPFPVARSRWRGTISTGFSGSTFVQPGPFFDSIILGGGAAGLMCAVVAGRGGRRVLVLEINDRVGRKIEISGGGRCNFTNVWGRARVLSLAES
jgi:hypothetical protein